MSLMNFELRGSSKVVSVPEGGQQELIEECPKESFREAIKYLIDRLDTYVVGA
jgi:hypothetical protein